MSVTSSRIIFISFSLFSSWCKHLLCILHLIDSILYIDSALYCIKLRFLICYWNAGLLRFLPSVNQLPFFFLALSLSPFSIQSVVFSSHLSFPIDTFMKKGWALLNFIENAKQDAAFTSSHSHCFTINLECSILILFLVCRIFLSVLYWIFGAHLVFCLIGFLN